MNEKYSIGVDVGGTNTDIGLVNENGVIVARSVVDVRREVVTAMSRHLSDAQAMEQEGVVASSAVAYMRFKLSEAERDLQEYQRL